MTISGGSALPKDEIDRMVREAEEHADEDRARREEAETRNQAETLVFQTEKFLADNTDKVPADARTEVDTALVDLKKALADPATPVDDIKAKVEAVSSSSQKLGAAMYAATEQAPADGDAPAGDGQQASADEDVVDAEVVDEDERR